MNEEIRIFGTYVRITWKKGQCICSHGIKYNIPQKLNNYKTKTLLREIIMTELSHFFLRLPEGEWCLTDHLSKRANIQSSLHLSTINNIFFETQTKMKGLIFLKSLTKLLLILNTRAVRIYTKNSFFIIFASTRKKKRKKINFPNNICSITFEKLCKWKVAIKNS